MDKFLLRTFCTGLGEGGAELKLNIIQNHSGWASEKKEYKLITYYIFIIQGKQLRIFSSKFIIFIYSFV